MPLQNRVTPFGTIIATPERGAWLGNRGRLHDGHRRLTRRRWTTRAWIICRLEFKGRRRVPMTPGRWTELFFLDEATALAAGHRPCWECRRADALAYRDAWARANAPGREPRQARAGDIDAVLHAERTTNVLRRPRVRTDDELPDGAMLLLPAAPTAAWLVAGDRLLEWSPGGYGEARARAGELALLLTPASSVAALAAGFRPQIDASAGL